MIEDACQAHGAEYKGRRAGSIGDLGCFSFYPGKNLGAYGEGGMVVTSNAEYARTIRMLRDWGAEKKYHHVLKGYNYRLEGIQGAVLRVKLRHLETLDRGAPRRRRALRPRCSPAAASPTPAAMPYARHVYHIYAIRTPQRAGLAGGAAAPRASRPASTTRSRCTCCRRSPTWATRPGSSRIRARGRRGAVAADVPGADRGAVRGGGAGRVELAGRRRERGRVRAAVMRRRIALSPTRASADC